jgi:hypothetical protein
MPGAPKLAAVHPNQKNLQFGTSLGEFPPVRGGQSLLVASD